jgi:catechol 2,3-dioxygenase-like lactoylglutathione lyase family enzyme
MSVPRSPESKLPGEVEAVRPCISHLAIRAADTAQLADFYQATFGLHEVARHDTRGNGNYAIYLSDGYINVALLPSRPGADREGIEHMGFSVADAAEVANTAKEHGATQGLEARPRDGRFAESRIYDPVGTPIDLSIKGWATEPGAGLRTPDQNA